MRLNQVKLVGFKSFVDLTKISFKSDLSAIVGPNGCGKSNIIDAVRWVLGESSAKNLRGDSMVDVIFNGSSTRKPLSVASVELTFGNEAANFGGKYASYSEIAVKRQVSRDGESNYFLNGQKCRRKDITDLFIGTGLGSKSYAIIEQGMISKLIESKPAELRNYIDEAAGISRYKDRRKETEGKISKTRDNLIRLSDIRQELVAQVAKLTIQSQAAKRFRQYKDEERKVHAEQLVLKFKEINEKADKLSSFIAKLQLNKEQKVTELTQIEIKLSDLDSSIKQQQSLEHKALDSWYQQKAVIAKVEQELKQFQEKQQNLELTKQKLIGQLNEQNDILEKISCSLVTLQDEYEALNIKLSQQNDDEDLLSETIEQLDENIELKGDQLRKLEQQLMGYTQEQRLLQTQHLHVKELNSNLARHKSELVKQLNQILSANTDQKTIESEINNNKEQLKIYEISLDSHIDKIKKLTLECGNLTDLINKNNRTQAEFSGRLSVLTKMLGDITTKKVWQSIDVTSGWENGVENLLSSILDQEVDSEYGFSSKQELKTSYFKTKLNISPWLNNLHWCASLDDAYKLKDTILPEDKIITAQGHIIGKGFTIQPKTNTIIKLYQEYKELVLELDKLVKSNDKIKVQHSSEGAALAKEQDEKIGLDTKISDIKTKTFQLEAALKEQKSQYSQNQLKKEELELKLNELNIQEELYFEQSDQYDAKIEDLSDKVLKYSSEYESEKDQFNLNKQQLNQLKIKQKESKDSLSRFRASIQSLDTKIALLLQQKEQTASKINELKAQILEFELPQDNDESYNQTIKLKQILEQNILQYTIFETELNSIRAQLLQSDQDQKQLQIIYGDKVREIGNITEDINQQKLQRESLNGQITMQIELLDEAQIKVQDIIGTISVDADSKTWQNKLDLIKDKIKRLGIINLTAIDEYELQLARKNELDQQDKDLNDALNSLEEAIKTIDKDTKSLFKETFEKINLNFSEIFAKMFIGGDAYLTLTEDDLLETGVAIMARPPGKKNSTIHLLSGGEKALTALALVFAMFKLQPAPFCLLDEVDAPLDDANVVRFCHLVKEMAKMVQFLYISHNKITMELAEQLIGVTMKEPGVSRIVSVDLNEAISFI